MRSLFSIIAAASCITQTPAGSDPDFGYDFVTIGDPGNRAPRVEETRTGDTAFSFGSVDYEYRIATTEVTVEQWFEFVLAYEPYVSEDDRYNPSFIGRGISFPVGGGPYFIDAHPRSPTTMSFPFAARYINWLHNGKATQQQAFERGVYDTSTFYFEGDMYQGQPTRAPGAKFWIPSVDEWVKAAYWDPDKDGGKGGYWTHPYASNDSPISGFPDQGGHTNAGGGIPFGTDPMPVMSYPDRSAPWGLFDVSGGVSEMTETRTNQFSSTRYAYGTQLGSFDDDFFGLDPIEQFRLHADFSNVSGLRLTSSIPAPGTLVVCSIYFLSLSRRRRECCSEKSHRAQHRAILEAMRDGADT